jgi:hypothetical protein
MATANPALGPTSPRDPYAGSNTRIPRPPFRKLWPRPAIMRHDPGLAASPLVRYILKMEGSVYCLRLRLPPAADGQPPRRRGAHGRAAGPGGSPPGPEGRPDPCHQADALSSPWSSPAPEPRVCWHPARHPVQCRPRAGRLHYHRRHDGGGGEPGHSWSQETRARPPRSRGRRPPPAPASCAPASPGGVTAPGTPRAE